MGQIVKEIVMKNFFSKFLLFFSAVVLLSVCTSGMAFADNGSAGEVFSKLANKAGVIGGGLRQSAFAIAGIGLLVFSFMAIFNKISWKNLAYIMMSCFILGIMAMIINYIGEGGGTPPNLSFDSGGAAIQGDTKSVEVKGNTPK